MKPSLRCLTGLLGLVAGCQAHSSFAATLLNTCEWGPSGSGTMTFILDMDSVYVRVMRRMEALSVADNSNVQSIMKDVPFFVITMAMFV